MYVDKKGRNERAWHALIQIVIRSRIRECFLKKGNRFIV